MTARDELARVLFEHYDKPGNAPEWAGLLSDAQRFSIADALIAAGYTLAPREPLGNEALAHIADPCSDGDIVSMLCGYVRPAQQPTSSDQPVCQSCAAVLLNERNRLNREKEAPSEPHVVRSVDELLALPAWALVGTDDGDVYRRYPEGHVRGADFACLTEARDYEHATYTAKDVLLMGTYPGPYLTILTPAPKPVVTEAMVEAGARALSQHSHDMHTNEALGKERMLARHVLTAALGGAE